MRNTTRAITAAVIVAIAPRLLLAADAPAAAAPAPPAVPALSDLLTGWGLTTSGEFAASYYHSNGYPGSFHAFDEDHDTLQLDEAGLQIGYQPKQGIGGYVDIIAGTDAQILNGAEGNSPSYVGLRQGYLQYATGPLTVIAGKFVTLAGAEVINPAQNTNFSRSMLFQLLEPLTHTGLRATYAVSDTVSVIVGVNNGWNYTDVATSGSKTGEFGATYTPNKILSFAVTGYIGKDDSNANAEVNLPGQQLSLIDLVATYNVTSALTVILNIDAKQSSGDGLAGTDASTHDTTHTDGFAAYANYAFTDSLRTSIRFEYLANHGPDDTVHPSHIVEGTATIGYSPVKNFEIRGELRYDKAQTDDAIFLRSLGSDSSETPPTFANNNFEFALQGVYKFSSP
jgi:hypothetical protein